MGCGCRMLEVGKKKEDIADLDGFRLLTGKSSLQLHPPIPIDISSLPPDILNIPPQTCRLHPGFGHSQWTIYLSYFLKLSLNTDIIKPYWGNCKYWWTWLRWILFDRISPIAVPTFQINFTQSFAMCTMPLACAVFEISWCSKLSHAKSQQYPW